MAAPTLLMFVLAALACGPAAAVQYTGNATFFDPSSGGVCGYPLNGSAWSRVALSPNSSLALQVICAVLADNQRQGCGRWTVS